MKYSLIYHWPFLFHILIIYLIVYAIYIPHLSLSGYTGNIYNHETIRN